MRIKPSATILPILATVFILSILVLSLPSVSFASSGKPHTHPAIKDHKIKNTVYSSNWAGYAVIGSPVSDVVMTWIQPSISCSSNSYNYTVIWAGIDGWNSGSVEQIGTGATCYYGSISYYAWYEYYPGPMVQISMTVVPGQNFYAEVYTAGNTYVVFLRNLNTGETYRTSQILSVCDCSAEWIVEAPSSNSGVLPLADFGTAYVGQDYTGSAFTSGYATINGVQGVISSFGSSVQQIDMTNPSNSNQILALTSALSTDGTSFTDIYQSPGGTTTTSTTTSSTSSTTSSSSSTTTTSSTISTTSTSSITSTTSTQTKQLFVSVSTDQPSYSRYSYALITVQVTDQLGNLVSGASVKVTVTNPNGGTGSATVKSSGGYAYVYDYISGRAPFGTYNVRAVASLSGYISGSGGTSFQVV